MLLVATVAYIQIAHFITPNYRCNKKLAKLLTKVLLSTSHDKYERRRRREQLNSPFLYRVGWPFEPLHLQPIGDTIKVKKRQVISIVFQTAFSQHSREL